MSDTDIFNSPTGKVVPVCTLKCVNPRRRRRLVRGYDIPVVDYDGIVFEQSHNNILTTTPKFVVDMIGASAPNDYIMIELFLSRGKLIRHIS